MLTLSPKVGEEKTRKWGRYDLKVGKVRLKSGEGFSGKWGRLHQKLGKVLPEVGDDIFLVGEELS